MSISFMDEYMYDIYFLVKNQKYEFLYLIKMIFIATMKIMMMTNLKLFFYGNKYDHDDD